MTYQRFWDLYITADDGRTDFGDDFVPMLGYQMTRHARPQKVVLMSGDAPRSPKHLYPIPLAGRSLPDEGYVTSVARVAEILGRIRSSDFQALIRWIDGAGQRGKLRVNAHGDGKGSFERLSGSTFVEWLKGNDLGERRSLTAEGKRSEGLLTLTLHLCMSARYGTQVATPTPSGTYQPAERSLLHTIASELGRQGCPGIEVTGTNNYTATSRGRFADVPGSNHGNTLIWLGEPPVGADWPRSDRAGEPGVRVTIPSGFRVEPTTATSTGVIHVPAGFLFEPASSNRSRAPSMGWELFVPSFVDPQRVAIPGNWIVDVAQRRITPPHGWSLTSNGTSGGEAYRAAPGIAERFAKSPHKVRQTSS